MRTEATKGVVRVDVHLTGEEAERLRFIAGNYYNNTPELAADALQEVRDRREFAYELYRSLHAALKEDD